MTQRSVPQKKFYCSQLPGERDTQHCAGLYGELPGSFGRWKEQNRKHHFSFIVVALGRNGQGKVSQLEQVWS